MELSLTLFFIATLAVIPFSVVSQDSPDDYVAAHNAARQAVGVGHITWNEKVAEYAKNYAAKRVGDCQLTHSGGAYGENIAWGSGDLSGARAVKLWVDEKPYYDYASNSCTQGKACGHYTQVVWRDSVQLGCAKVKCTNGRGTFIICSYNPPGNIVGQRPY